jgi:16S rRNA (uracil1498-N3)-methyltransferase
VGVARFRPFVSSRTLPGLVRAGVPEKMTRWNKVLREAARQSRRDFLPELELPLSWEGFLECLEEGHLTLLAWEEEKERRVLDALPREAPESVALVVGPEGGFSVREVEEMREAGAVTVSLGSNILRTENAGMVMAVLAGGFYGRI